MGQHELSELADRLRNDWQLRTRFTQDPEAAAAEAGPRQQAGPLGRARVTVGRRPGRTRPETGAHEMDEAELAAPVSKRDSNPC
jgi:hypothetical protein